MRGFLLAAVLCIMCNSAASQVVTPAGITCPIDNIYVGFSGHERDRNGEHQCDFQHVWIHYIGGILVDEKHIIWAKCEVK